VLSVGRVYMEGWFRTLVKRLYLYLAVLLGEVLTVGGSALAAGALEK
jgi:hypothetical protein